MGKYGAPTTRVTLSCRNRHIPWQLAKGYWWTSGMIKESEGRSKYDTTGVQRPSSSGYGNGMNIAVREPSCQSCRIRSCTTSSAHREDPILGCVLSTIIFVSRRHGRGDAAASAWQKEMFNRRSGIRSRRPPTPCGQFASFQLL